MTNTITPEEARRVERGPIEIRTATIEGVSFPDRIVDLVVAPYDEDAVVEYEGRMIEESLAPGAFGAIANRARKFLVNMEHDPDRWVGTVLALDGANPKGLHASIKIRRTRDGDQALTDCADGFLGASVGMAVARGDQTFTGGKDGLQHRRIHKAYLDHVALTGTPAYVGAEVVEVRSIREVGGTPNLDAALALMAARGNFRIK